MSMTNCMKSSNNLHASARHNLRSLLTNSTTSRWEKTNEKNKHVKVNLANLSLTEAFLSLSARLKSSHNRLMFSIRSSSSMTRAMRRGSPRRSLYTDRQIYTQTYTRTHTDTHAHMYTDTSSSPSSYLWWVALWAQKFPVENFTRYLF